jgi:hypothetical protein
MRIKIVKGNELMKEVSHSKYVVNVNKNHTLTFYIHQSYVCYTCKVLQVELNPDNKLPMLVNKGALFLGVKWPGQEADHSPPSSAKAKNVQSYTSTPPICLRGMVLS